MQIWPSRPSRCRINQTQIVFNPAYLDYIITNRFNFESRCSTGSDYFISTHISLRWLIIISKIDILCLSKWKLKFVWRSAFIYNKGAGGYGHIHIERSAVKIILYRLSRRIRPKLWSACWCLTTLVLSCLILRVCWWSAAPGDLFEEAKIISLTAPRIASHDTVFTV